MIARKPTKKAADLPDVDELDALVAESDALLKQQEALERKASRKAMAKR